MTINVRSNQGPPVPAQWLRPTPKDTSFAEMQRRLRTDGYVFVKNLLPREEVQRVRKEYFTQYEPTGILKPGTPLEDGIFNDENNPLAHGGIGAGELPPTDLQVKTMIEAHTQPEYLRMLQNAEFRKFVRGIMGWEKEILLTRTMIRHNAPGALSTGVHYDKLFLRKGEAEFLTAWVPIGESNYPTYLDFLVRLILIIKIIIGDTKATGGGLMYLSDSVSIGREIEEDFTQRAKVLSDDERLSAFNVHMEKYGQLSQNASEFGELHQSDGEKSHHHWLVADYEVGDMVFHDPYIVHASSKNEDVDGRIRVSTDLRFYEDGSDMDDRWMKLWTPGDGL
ncbi:hypothetical protein N7488_006627 [Penicillium malachiteum]|nr:hypothetical protein N7488_006627 [Penicillium malachiteum]